MSLKKNEQSTDDQDEARTMKEKADTLSDELVDGLDLPELKGPENKDSDLQGGEVKDAPEEEEQEEEEPQDEDQTEEEEEEEEEDVVPKSKFEKRLQSEVARRKVLEARLKELEEKKTSSPDNRRERLQAMSQSELKALKRDARKEWKHTDDPSREAQLDELMDEIDEVIVSQPKLFEQKQVKAYEDAVQDIMTDPANEKIDLEANAVEIKKIATNIYQKYPELRKMETGQATALRMAVDHFRETKAFIKGKSKTEKLKRQNNKLKRKTSLDSSALKGKSASADLTKAREKAKKSNSFYDKLDYIGHRIDVDQYVK